MRKKTIQYIREYEWSSIFAMIRNNRKDPQLCTDDFKEKLVEVRSYGGKPIVRE